VVADPQGAGAQEVVQKALGALHPGESLAGEGRVVRKARGQAGRRGAIPVRQAGAAGQRADLGLAQAGLGQGRAGADLTGRRRSGAVLEMIVGVLAVHQHGAVALGCQVAQQFEPGTLTVVAAVHGVARHLGVGQVVKG